MIRPYLFAAALAATIFASAAADAASVQATSTSGVGSVLNSLASRMNGVAGYHANIVVNIQMHSFPYLAFDLQGTTTYQRPDKYTVTFDSVPELASAFQKVSGDIGDPAAWSTKYDVTLDPSSAKAAPGTVVLRLVEKVDGQIDHALAYVDLASSTVTKMDWYYKSGGTITMDQHFMPVNGVLVTDKQNADIEMPGYKASAQATIGNYNIQEAAAPAPGAPAN